jgi:hypothetical protein
MFGEGRRYTSDLSDVALKLQGMAGGEVVYATISDDRGLSSR